MFSPLFIQESKNNNVCVSCMLHICSLQVSQLHASCFCWTHTHVALIILSFPLGTNSKHVDLKLKKLVDVSPRRVTSPSSTSSTSSSPTASSASPVSPTEGQEVYPHSGHSYFPQLFPFLSSSFLLSLSVYFMRSSLSSLSTIKGSSDQSGLIVPVFQSGDLVYASLS